MSLLLAGDVGGTKTNLAIVSGEQGPCAVLAEATFHSGQYNSLEALVGEFLGQTRLKVGYACFGVAGPVENNRAQITNLSWELDADNLRKALNLAGVDLLNDLEAMGYGVPMLAANELHTINIGQAAPGGAIAIVAPGTGLGEAYLTWGGKGYQAHPCEGGHCDFAPTSPFETDLLRYLQDKFGHVSYERVCSGIGIPNIYDYLKESGFAQEQVEMTQQLAASDDRTPVIVNAALAPNPPSALCSKTLELFMDILAAEAGNMALKILATGGVYLGGGIPPRILSVLKRERFMAIFSQKGRMGHMLGRMPVQVILNHSVGLLGAACYGLQAWSKVMH